MFCGLLSLINSGFQTGTFVVSRDWGYGFLGELCKVGRRRVSEL
jgi:hypothetical protein